VVGSSINSNSGRLSMTSRYVQPALHTARERFDPIVRGGRAQLTNSSSSAARLADISGGGRSKVAAVDQEVVPHRELGGRGLSSWGTTPKFCSPDVRPVMCRIRAEISAVRPRMRGETQTESHTASRLLAAPFRARSPTPSPCSTKGKLEVRRRSTGDEGTPSCFVSGARRHHRNA